MLNFRQLREASKTVFNKKIERVPVKIVKDTKGFTVFIDGDKLDTFKSQSEAEKTAKTVVKELK